MDYLYKKTPSKKSPPKNEIVLPATIVTHEIPKPVKGSVEPEPFRESEPEVKQLGHITFISQEEYLRDIESMCKRDKWFMETIKGFCDKAVGVNVGDTKGGLEQSVQSDESTSVNEEGSE
jgi:hypothetical protein